MPPSEETLRPLKEEIEKFLASLERPVLVEDGVELFDLSAGRWKVSIEFGKLILEAWNASRSLGRRVEEVAYRDGGRLGLFVRKPGARESSTLELRALAPPFRGGRPGRRLQRGDFQKSLLAMLGQEYPGWRLERASSRSDREHSFSSSYTRGVARRGTLAWAFVALPPEENAGASEPLLAYALIWVDWLRRNDRRSAVGGLKLFVPSRAVEATAHRASCINPKAVQLEIRAWEPGAAPAAPVDLKDFGNVETHLVPRRQGELLLERHGDLLRDLLGDSAAHVAIVPDSTGERLSLRVRGLEVARVEGQAVPEIFFGLEGASRRLAEANRAEFLEFLSQVIEARRAGSRDTGHEFYRLQSERWLESVLLEEVTKIDPSLDGRFVYPQVPAFTGQNRGVIDILGATRQGRLAVIELKLEENVGLPIQGLDYWLRVKWLAERGQFHEFGYFPGLDLSRLPPLLYLVSPAFRFHSSTDAVLRFFGSSFQAVKIGLGARWRQKIKVLFRHEMRPAGV